MKGQQVCKAVPGTFFAFFEALKAFAGKRRLSMNVAATLAVEAMLETEDA